MFGAGAVVVPWDVDDVDTEPDDGTDALEKARPDCGAAAGVSEIRSRR